MSNEMEFREVEGEEKGLLLNQENVKRTYCHPLRPKFVEPVVLLFGFAYFFYSPLVLLFLNSRMRELYNPHVQYGDAQMNETDFNNSVDFLTAVVSSKAASFFSTLSLFRCVPPCITGLIICSCTDAFGRKLGLAITIFGGVIRGIVFLSVEHLHLPLEWMYVGELLDGIMGEHIVFIGCSMAYLADVVDHTHIVVRSVIFNSIFYIAATSGNVLTGITVENLGFTAAFVIGFSNYVFGLLYVIFILPESLEDEHRKKFSCAGVTKNIANSVLIFFQSEEKNRTAMRLLFVGFFIAMLIYPASLDVLNLYAQGPPFAASAKSVGLLLASSCVGCIIIPPILGKTLKVCLSDNMLLVASALMGILNFLSLGFCSTLTELFIGNFNSIISKA